MKSYEQMAADVLLRAQIYTCKRNRNRKIAASASCFGCLVLLAVISILTYKHRGTGELPVLEQPPAQLGSQPTEDVKEPECVLPLVTAPSEDLQQDFEIVLLVASSSNDVGTELTENLTLPLNYSLRVRDLRGLSDSEREIVIDEERAFYREQMSSIPSGAGVKHGNCAPRKNYVISFVRIGCFRLQIENYDQVESISIKSSTRYSKLDVALSEFPLPKGQEIELVPEDIPEWDRENGLRINWGYSSALLQVLDEDPAMPLSNFSDTVTFSVKLLDGTVKETNVQVMIQDDGQVVVSLLSGAGYV